MIFLYDGNVAYSYNRLLDDINASTKYYPIYKTNNLYCYFVNLLVALSCGKPVTLIDSDFSETEIKGIGVLALNEPSQIENIKVSTFEELLARIIRSDSKINIFTSGTTGQPKRVEHTISTLTRSVRREDSHSADIWGFAYNPTHMAGLQVFFQAFENKNPIVNVFNVARSDVYKNIEKYRISHISATPTFYRLLFPAEIICTSVVRVTLGGEKSDQNLLDKIKDIFPNAKINNVYASTEAGTLFASKGNSFQIPSNLRDKVLVKNGELIIHKSLLGSSESLVLENDFYHTGDMIIWVNEKDGVFCFSNRKNELINTGGYKVNPHEVEEILFELKDVKQAVVYGRSNSILGNILCADICVQESSILTEISIKQYLREKLQDYKIPRRIKIVANIELTRTGKLKRQ